MLSKIIGFSLLVSTSLCAAPIPEKALKIMHAQKYDHSNWGLFVKDLTSGEILYDQNSEQMFLPASTTKLFSVAAVLHAYGDDYRFKTPVYAVGKIQDGRLSGDLVMVGQGDLTMGGRQDGADTIAYTKMDHIIANEVPGVILTKQDPLYAFKDLAKQISAKGIKAIDGNVLIDDRLFDISEQRGSVISPIIVNENLIDLLFNPGEVGQKAGLAWRPMVDGYTVENAVKTVTSGQPLDIQVVTDESGRHIIVNGSLPQDKKNIVRTAQIKHPAEFARAALIDALRAQSIQVNVAGDATRLPSENVLKELQPIAIWTSPPLTEYGKLILKVSHNSGANLIPMLLAVKEGKRTFNDGLKALGTFATDVAKISPDAFVFLDGAGGDNNRLTPHAEVKLLEYMHQKPKEQFQKYDAMLPILGVDGSLADFGKDTDAVGKVRAKPGTGVTFNTATGHYFLTTQALSGYIEGKPGHVLAYMLVVNNGTMPKIDDIFPIFEDLSQISSIIYDIAK